MSEEPIKTKWYEEAPGQSSSVRQGMMICVLVAGFLAIAGMWRGANLIELSALCAMFLGAGFGAKVSQKGRE